MNGSLLFSQAFRPFFLLAALAAGGGTAWWVAALAGHAPMPPHAMLWHAHEMLFGYALALIAGFVLTAVNNWTRQVSASPRELIALASVWLIARVFGAVEGGTLISSITAAADTLFLAGLAGLMTRVLLRAKNQRNYMFIPFLWALTAIGGSYYLLLAQGRHAGAHTLLMAVVYLVSFLMVFMGGRVIPFFTGNRAGYTPTQFKALNWFSTLSALAAGLALTALPGSLLAATVALVAGVATLLRLLLWQPWKVLKIPMLWILHWGYLWLGVGWLLSGLDALKIVPHSAALHALMAGALGSLGLGMMARVALGHSGRQIEASPLIVLAFALIVLAGLLRVGFGLQLPFFNSMAMLNVAAAVWCAAFALYFVAFVPVMARPAAR